MNNAFKLFYFKGTPVYLKYWFFILLLFGPIFFISILIAVLVHELAHAYVGKLLGCDVDKVYIDILYGAAEIDMTHTSNRDDIFIVAAGPLSNLLLFGLGYLCINSGYIDNTILLEFLTKSNELNLILFIFNILPIFPMDGGRISKSIFSIMFGNRIGKFIGGVLSIMTAILLCFISFGLIPDFFNTGMFPNPIIGIFSLFFLFLSYKEIK
jgi:stage IV sporulation protein FB